MTHPHVASVCLLGLAVTAGALSAQGPTLSYLADPSTNLSWAECYVRLDGGSKHKISFLPIFNGNDAPMGTEHYTKDIRLDAPIAFVGNGIVLEGRFDAYRNLDVAGKVVMFAYDLPNGVQDDLEKQVSFEERMRAAVGHKAAGIVAVSMTKEYPFPVYHGTDATIPEIPAIAVNRAAAVVILASAGLDAEKVFDEWRVKGSPEPAILISKLDLRIEGRFDSIETDNFSFRFQPGGISSAQARALADVNERSVKFIVSLLKDATLAWRTAFTVYFSDYDSKLFYVRHWGRGLSSDAGAFMVFRGPVPDFGLAAHENMHTLLDHQWGSTSSFLNEGFGKYAEAMATDTDRNHLQTIAFLKAGKLFRLDEMSKVNIGSDPRTDVAYPAAGSFVQYLVQTFPIAKVKVAWEMAGGRQIATDPWRIALGKPLSELERNWLYWLAAEYKVDQKYVDEYLAK